MNHVPAPVEQLLRGLDEAFDRKAWHGPTLRGALRGVSARQAAWRPLPGSHNIWELAVHAAYWKHAVCRLIVGGKRGSFPLKGSNWFVRPSSSSDAKTNLDAAWRADVRLLQDEHRLLRLLRRTMSTVDAATLDRRLRGKAYSTGFVLRGIAAHDLYHAGQVQLLKRLYKLTERQAKIPLDVGPAARRS